MVEPKYYEDDELLNEDEESLIVNDGITEDLNDTGIHDEAVEEEESDTYKVDASKLDGITSYEIELTKAYDDIAKSSGIEDAVYLIVQANPQHTNSATISNVVKDILNKQGHSRMQNSYSSGLLRGYEVDSELDEDDSGEFNETFRNKSRDLVSRFVEWLVNRDTSEDNLANIRRKQRHLPAFIIFLLSNNMYDLIINCPTLPDDYKSQVKVALDKLHEAKHEVVEELAEKYDQAGRPEVAKKVRQLGVTWFDKEPAEIINSAEFRDLKLTMDDVNIYRTVRPKFINISSAITQDVASELIEVVIDPEAGVFEKLKDKVRTEAINEVKTLFRDYAKASAQEEDAKVAQDIIFK